MTKSRHKFLKLHVIAKKREVFMVSNCHFRRLSNPGVLRSLIPTDPMMLICTDGVTQMNRQATPKKYPKKETPVISHNRKKITAEISAMEYFNGCAYCGRNDVPLEMDHFLAYSMGGSNEKNNIVPACIYCNRSKGAKEPVDWVLNNFDRKTLSKLLRYLCSI